MSHFTKALEEGKEEFKQFEFSTCPTETEEPFFWKWSEHGSEMIEIFLTQFAEKIRQAVAEDVVEYCKKVMEINTRVYGTDKWNGDLEDLVKFLSDLPTKENN